MDAGHITSAFSPQEAKEATSRAGSRAVPRSSRTDGEQPAPICFPFAGGIMGGSHISALRLLGALYRQKYRTVLVMPQEVGRASGRGRVCRYLYISGVSVT